MAVERIDDESLRRQLLETGLEELERLPVEFLDEEAEDPGGNLTQLIREMSVPERIRLAIFGNQMVRSVLLRDSYKQIPLLVLANPRLTENEVLEIAKNTQLDDGVLRALANDAQWMKSYQVKLAIVSNPKVPINSGLRWLKFIRDKDLGRLARSKNIPQVVSSQARKLLEQRKGTPG